MNGLETKNLDELKTIGGKVLVLELIHLFIDESIHVIQKLNLAVDKDQQEDIGQIAHKLKSSAGSLGLVGLSDFCFKVDSKRRSGEQIAYADVEQIIQMINTGRELLLSYKKTLI